LEVVDVDDLLQLTTLLDAARARIEPGFDLGRT
jgi:hypothetical protein